MASKQIFGMDTDGWLSKASLVDDFDPTITDGPVATVVLVGQAGEPESVTNIFAEDLRPWQIEAVTKRRSSVVELSLTAGPLWVVAIPQDREDQVHGGYLEPTVYGMARDAMGQIVSSERLRGCEKLVFLNEAATAEEKLGALVGFELAGYMQKDLGRKRLPKLVLAGISERKLREAQYLGEATNLARHLTNTPANRLNPTTFAQSMKELFRGSASTKVTIWDYDKLQKEKMALICAVGQASEHKPCMIHVRYRPKGRARKKKPVAYVGKGITFDSGGLNIKPGTSMRLMKKDMGGSASVAGFAYWLDRSGVDHPADLYLAVAENAISDEAFRPGDVYEARNGISVEIDNTDAEGRLVMADVLSVATESKGEHAPTAVINLATLTGSMRIALGTKLAGMFSNDDDLADKIHDAAYAMGEPLWRMPLFQPYREQLNSPLADMVNSGGRFGGAITAALFLERFVNEVPWAHFDIFAWTDRPDGACLEGGGTGQMVQTLAGIALGKC